ncbi:hypothetical protein Ahy_B09g097355 [Arachis hypogaea]|uniref:Replication protein A 70 kDa DNA-binding subunit B/D first OB fold domain-containing protein n=1 Tax=Arachis hypogaea TaxID=3818 RepID=A0A444XP23_ARAHY|nr:hypothetical protein Ahy_B09g097355 [Arachis hypogaea]
MELVVLDKEGSRIHCFIRSFYYRLFEPILEEDKAYFLANFTTDSNTLKFKPTKHNIRIIFKRDTMDILSSVRDDLFLIDFIGLLSAKTDLIPFEKKAKKPHYMKIELDDLSEKLSCTLWENYASDFVTLLVAYKATEYIIVLQFAKMKLYIGVMTVTNTNFTTKIMVNADLEMVKKFHQSTLLLTNKLTLLNLICDLMTSFFPIRLIGFGGKHSTNVDKSTYVTCGTVIDIDRNHAWWYKACRKCTQGLESLTDQFYCAKCDIYVVDDSDTATFVLFENSASKFLGVSATDICYDLLAKGYGSDHFPRDLNALIGKTLLFKLTSRPDSLNKFQPCVITVSRICSDPEIIMSLASDNNINLDVLQKVAITPVNAMMKRLELATSAGLLVPSPLRSRMPQLFAPWTLNPWSPIHLTDDSGSSRAPCTASKNLLPAFEKCMIENANNPGAEDI